jgi:hypothetical protein
MTSSSAAIARVTAWPVWVHVMFASLCWIVIPRQEVLEYGTRVVEILSPPTPVADLPKRPASHRVQKLTPAATKRVGAIWTRINTYVEEIVSETFEEGVRGLSITYQF